MEGGDQSGVILPGLGLAEKANVVMYSKSFDA